MGVPKVVIVGGGVSGLATAYFLGGRGIRSVVIEKSERVGGLINTELIQGCRLEAGPDSYIAAKPAVSELAKELGDLEQQIIGSNDQARKIYLVRGGKLIPMPAGMVMIAPSRLKPALGSELFGMGTKLRVLTELLSKPKERTEDVSIRTLVEDHFGHEWLEYITEPLLSGVYGGDSAQLSAKSVLPRFVDYERRYGSLTRGVQHEKRKQAAGGSLFLSFRDGMESLIHALKAATGDSAMTVREKARKLEKSTSGWRVICDGQTVEADHVVLAAPAYENARLLESAAPALASELADIPYSSALLVTLVYSQAGLDHSLEGFGFLVPRPERKSIAAATWIKTKFPSRIPASLAAVRVFIVDPEATALSKASNEELVLLAKDDLQRLMGIRSEPLFTLVNAWPNSMPQYTVGHSERMKRIAEQKRVLPGLHLVGNAYEGVGIPDCVRLAEQTANDVGLSLMNSSI